MEKLTAELAEGRATAEELDQARTEAKEHHDELVVTQKALDRAGAQAAELRIELTQTQQELDRARMEAEEVASLRTKLADAELAIKEAKEGQEQTRDRLGRLEAQLAAAQGAAFASERAAEQLRQAQERMREALAPDEGATTDGDADADRPPSERRAARRLARRDLQVRQRELHDPLEGRGRHGAAVDVAARRVDHDRHEQPRVPRRREADERRDEVGLRVAALDRLLGRAGLAGERVALDLRLLRGAARPRARPRACATPAPPSAA